MKVRYSKKRLFSSLLLGGLFSLMGALKIYEGTADFFNHFQLFFGIFVTGSFFFERHYQYLRIENGFLTKNSIRRKTIELAEIKKIQSFPGKIKLFTSEKSLTISPGIIDADSIQDLYIVLGSLELYPKKNLFVGWSQKS